MSRSKSKSYIPKDERRKAPRMEPYKRPHSYEWGYAEEEDVLDYETILEHDRHFYVVTPTGDRLGPFEDEEQAEYAMMRWAQNE